MRLIVSAIVLALLAGCASAPSPEPKIARISPEELERLMPQPVPNLTLEEIVRLSQAGEPAESIIVKIRDTYSSYALTPEQIVELNRKGVSMRVLDYIFSAQQQALRDSMADEFNQRERKHREEVEALKLELMQEPYFYDPFWPQYPYSDYSHHYWRR